MKLLDEQKKQHKRWLTRWRNEHSIVETAKEAGRIEVERRDMPQTDIGLAAFRFIKEIERIIMKIYGKGNRKAREPDQGVERGAAYVRGSKEQRS